MLAWLTMPTVGQPPPAAQRADRPKAPRPTAEEAQPPVDQPEATKQPERLPAPPLRFQATVFQVELTNQRAVELDAKRLTASGATPAELYKVLHEFGSTQVLYRVDQAIDAHAKICITGDAPYVTGTSTTAAGQTSTAVARERLGAQFEIVVRPAGEQAPGCVGLSLHVEITCLTSSVVQTAKDVTAPVFRRIEQSSGGLIELGKPLVLVSVDGASTTESDKTLAFVSLVVLNRLRD
jgi:hypothetical protein